MKKYVLFAACLLAAFLPRLIMALNTPVIAIDGVGYIEASRGGTDAAAGARLPLYPSLIRIVGGMTGDPVTAGKAISVVCGTLFALLMGWLAHGLSPRRGAWAVFLLAAFQPYLIRFSGDVLTEPLFLCLMAGLFLCLEYARHRPLFAVLGGLAGAGLCLTRPEGLAVTLVATLAFAWDGRPGSARKGDLPGSRGLAPGAFLYIAVLLACLMPAYLVGVFNKNTEGTLAKTYFENLATMEGTTPPEHPPSLVDFIRTEPGRFAEKTVRGLGEGLLRLSEAVHPAVFLLALIGLWASWKNRPRPAPMHPALWSSFFLFLFFCVVYPSKRYMLQCSIPFLLWAGWAVQWLHGRGRRGPPVALLVLGMTLILCQAKAGFGQRGDKRFLRDRGEEIASMCEGRLPVLITPFSRLAFYAGAKRIDPRDLEGNASALDLDKLGPLIRDLPPNRIFYVYEKEDDLPGLANTDLKITPITLR